MELDKINKLLNNYFEAKTSVEEEKELQAYFSSGNVAPEHQEYISLFSFSKTQKEIEFEKELPRSRRNGLYAWFSAAASIAIIGGVFLFNEQKSAENLGTYENPELALQKTKDVLNMVSFYMNKGQDKLEYVNQFGETTERLIKNN